MTDMNSEDQSQEPRTVARSLPIAFYTQPKVAQGRIVQLRSANLLLLIAKEIDRAEAGSAVVRLIAVHSRGIAGFINRSHCQRVTREGNTVSKVILGLCIGSFEVGLLGPGATASGKHIDRAGAGAGEDVDEENDNISMIAVRALAKDEIRD